MTAHCGIDFGTSNSAIGLECHGRIMLAPVEGRNETLPSTVFYPSAGGPFFGQKAIDTFINGGNGRFMRSLKRILGTSLMEQGTIVNGKKMFFDDILSRFIGHLKARAEALSGNSLDSVVMGRPVFFVDNDDAANARAQNELGEIARKTGFRHIEFQFEPIAAAFSHERSITGEKLGLVVDIGGGTSDFTVIRMSGNNKNKADRTGDILANTGIRTGGNDFDKDLCLAAFMPRFGFRGTYGDKNLPLPASPFFEMSEWSKVNFLYTKKIRDQMESLYYESHDKDAFGRFVRLIHDETGHELLSVVEGSKISLTARAETEACLDFVEEGFRIRTTKAAFDTAIQKHVDDISRAITHCLGQAGTGEEKIELIVLTGGTTEVPLLRNTVRQRFPHAQLSEEDKISSVAHGLACDSARRFG